MSRSTLLRALIYLFCFASGASALVYQVVWVRQLGLVFGVTSYAVATVLAAFMGGLALGGWLFGRLALSARRILGLYGLLEIGIGLAALALPLAFQALQDHYAALYQALASSPGLFAVLRFAVLALLLAVPCTLMGGTVAVLARVMSRRQESLGWDVGLLYGWNTLGAVWGALGAGFVMLPELGLAATNHVAAAVNVVVGLNALVLQFVVARTRAEVGEGSPPPPGEAAPRPVLARLAVLVFGVSGFCALGYEVLWARTLVFYLHNSTYAFTAMLACFLAGIGLGSLLPARRVDRTEHPARWLAATQLLIAGFTLLSLHLFASLPRILDLFTRFTLIDAWWKALAVQGTQAAIVLLPATFCMGLAFPVAVRLASSHATVSRDVGVLYAVNTVGAILGSLGVGFVLLPWLGLVGSFRLLVALNLAAGIVVLLGGRRRRAALWVAAAPLLAFAAVPGDVFTRAFEQGSTLLFYRDGVADTVMVKAKDEGSAERALYFTDGRGTAGTMTNPENRIYAHLPLLVHGAARRVLSIGFGVGNTLAGFVTHPELEEVAVVELSPNVLAAAPYFPTNDRAWEDPRVVVHVQDGRNFLLGRGERWDVIQLEPPEIHTEGVVYLYTRELYELARRRLEPGGIVCQWANVRMMPLDEQKMLVRTFLEVFPHGTVWLPRLMTGYVLLLGGEDELKIDYTRFRQGFEVPPVRRDLAENAGVQTPAGLLAGFKLSSEGARRWSAGAAVLTDDRTWVDFMTPRSVDANYGLSNAFSGLVVPVFLPGGWPATRDYQALKLRSTAAAMESVVPYLDGFASADERAEVTAQLRGIARRFQELTAARIEALRTSDEPLVNM